MFCSCSLFIYLFISRLKTRHSPRSSNLAKVYKWFVPLKNSRTPLPEILQWVKNCEILARCRISKRWVTLTVCTDTWQWRTHEPRHLFLVYFLLCSPFPPFFLSFYRLPISFPAPRSGPLKSTWDSEECYKLCQWRACSLLLAF